ncbi:MAG: hypothetical protein KatS3mg104_1089 [Phycisphaerae bacterium]|jgi:hypothetical protein|nr:MAG: hypothetical protein KatS3mg104_1089 [Phycisphaerae bacterium]
MTKTFFALLIGIVCFSTGCASQTLLQVRPGQIQHVVVVWLKPEADRHAVIRSIQTLREVPGVIDIRVGQKLASDRQVVDSTYDLMLVFTFENEQALRDYDRSPQHQEVVESVIKPYVARFIVYDASVVDYAMGQQVEQDLEQFRRQSLEKQRKFIDRRS